ncbi:MAG: dipeptidase [Candidatus Dormibacteraeota bacterium]|nr:dipeptidase [Candidatus Dormibacteraeota bacterium]
MIPVFDGHNDVVLDVYGWGGQHQRRGFFERGERGHLDLPRMREGGFAGGIFAVFVPADPTSARPDLRQVLPPEDRSPNGLAAPIGQEYALRSAVALISTLLRLERESRGEFVIVHDVAAIRACMAEGKIAAVLHLEGAEPIDPGLNSLEVFYRAGLRSLGLVWSRPNAFAEGVPFAFPSSPDTGPGLTQAGRELVRACNQLGILIDLSHLNQRGFWDVAELSTAPLVASHSNAHTVTPVSRNLLDDQLDAIQASGGIVGLNYAVQFTRLDGKHDADTPLTDLVRHVDYLVEKMGIDHVGLGSDFDGATVPEELHDVAGLPRLMAALEDAGYSERDLSKIAHENWLRVLETTWQPAG